MPVYKDIWYFISFQRIPLFPEKQNLCRLTRVWKGLRLSENPRTNTRRMKVLLSTMWNGVQHLATCYVGGSREAKLVGRQFFFFNLSHSELLPEGVSPWALLRLAGGGNVSNFEKLTFLFFSDSDSFGSKKNRAKKIFSKFENFSVSVFQCFTVSLFQSILVIWLSPKLSRFST